MRGKVQDKERMGKERKTREDKRQNKTSGIKKKLCQQDRLVLNLERSVNTSLAALLVLEQPGD